MDRRGSDSKEEGGDKPRRNVSWQDKNPVVVPVESDAEHSDAEKEEDVGITFIAHKPETPKPRPKSGESTRTHAHTHVRAHTSYLHSESELMLLPVGLHYVVML
ncbi:hypothetical protein JOQ06_000705 [Pogonophryne albipinna]|uniref:Uncharacterized protein n=1 Tax=Pogonophryne albipinna TaxID=1090488 RepID=A0AAD6F2Z7_9TELE|nr:hypothetical protein JOQ06_000705 [Pogonophryne albipinna]